MDHQTAHQELFPGKRVVHKVYLYTGEIYKMKPTWAEVWNIDRGYEREEWPLGNIAIRTPRLIKRWPRPLRFPREVPSSVCHCKIGRMVVEGPNEIRCTRCTFLIGEESFPRRIRRAEKFLRKAYPSPRPKSKVRRRIPRRRPRKVVRRRGKGRKSKRKKS